MPNTTKNKIDKTIAIEIITLMKFEIWDLYILLYDNFKY